MRSISTKMRIVLAIVVGGILMAGPAMAGKPPWAGSGKGGKDAQKNERSKEAGPSEGVHVRFEEQHRAKAHEYYAEQFRNGNCPPGLAKKHNGCMPPGLAKKWSIGRPLPRDVVSYELPQPVIVRIGPPPAGYRYLRVANDILMVAAGTNMVVDAITDLGR